MADLQIPETEHYREAIDSVRKRVPVPRSVWDTMQADEREHAFTVSQVARMDVLQDVLDSMDKAVEKGTALDDFRAEVADKLIEQWGGSEIPNRIETIFRTNIQVAYAEGRHAINSAPAVKEARPFWRYDDTDNDRECDLCHECGGVVLPADDPWWRTHTPPLHHQAILAGSLVATARGAVRASELEIGDLVVTHKGRLRPVTALMFKVSRDKSVRVLQTDSGRVLAITHEHPVLVDSPSRGLVWKAAGQLEIGDVLFQLNDETTGTQSSRVAHPEDAPPLGREPRVSGGVVGFPVPGPVILSVYLDGDQVAGESHVNNVGPNGMLRDRSEGSKEREQVLFSWGEFLSVGEALAPGSGDANALIEARVLGAHPFGDHREALPPRVMVDPCSLGDDIRASLRDRGLLPTGSHADAEFAAPMIEHSNREPEFLFHLPNASALLPMLRLNQGSESVVRPLCFSHARIIAITEKMYDGQLCDFEVAEDNSYTADGVLVHNCECQVTALSPEEAEEEGVTGARDMPDVEADEGFGNEPTSSGKDWAPDLEKYDPELREALEKMLARYEG